MASLQRALGESQPLLQRSASCSKSIARARLLIADAASREAIDCPVAMRGAPLFRATADSHNGRLRKARGSTLRSPATAERLRRSFAATRDRKKLDNLSTKRLSKAFKNSDRGVFQPSLQTTHISAVNLSYGQKIKTAAKMTVVQASTMEQLSAPFPTAPHGSA